MIAFRTSSDEQLQKFIAWQGEREAWSDAAHALTKEATGDDRFLSYGAGRFAAFTWESDDEPPAGLKRVKAHDGIVPDKRIKAGKEWAKRIAALPKLTKTCRCDGEPKGMVMHARRGQDGLLVHDAQYHRFQQTGPLYMIWNCECDDEQRESIVNQVDASIWEFVKLSDFYAEVEAEKEWSAAQKAQAA